MMYTNDQRDNARIPGEVAVEAAHQQAHAAGMAAHAAGAGLVDAEQVLGKRCASCDGYMCVDCAEGVPHGKCTRACPDCLLEFDNWDADLEHTRISPEMWGLRALEEALFSLEDRGRPGGQGHSGSGVGRREGA